MMTDQTTDWLPGANQNQPKPKSPNKSNLNDTTSLHQASSPDFETTSTRDTGADHLNAFTVDALEGEGDDFAGVDGLSGLADETGEFISRDVFFEGFCSAFNIGACIPPYFQSLKIQNDRDQARAAADALYDICLETPSMHFMIKPGGVWFQRITAIGAFALPKAMGVAAEMQARKEMTHKAAQQAPRTEKPAKGEHPETSMPSGDPMGWAPKSEAA